MKIGLVRHFEVDCPHKSLLSSKEYEEWVIRYDDSPIKIKTVAANLYEWEKCYCSDLSRAIKTAQHFYKGEIHQSSLLREVPIASVFTSHIKLPYTFWMLAGRVAWLLSHSSQPETINQTKERAKQFVSEMIAQTEKNVLIVTHGFFMMQLQKELQSRGFSGESCKNAKNGFLYLFKKDDNL